MSDSESSGSEVEWEDVEPLVGDNLFLVGGGERTAPDHESSSVEVTLPKSGPSKGNKQNFLERAISNFKKEMRISCHQVHLLCLLAHGLQLSAQCDSPLLQALLLSLTPTMFALLERKELENEKALLKFIRWFGPSVGRLRESVKDTATGEFCLQSDVLFLVTLLRGMGLRARLVLVLEPSPLKPLAKKKTESKAKKQYVTSGPPKTASLSGTQHSHATIDSPPCSSMDLSAHVDQFKYESPPSGKNVSRSRTACLFPEVSVASGTKGKLPRKKSSSSSSSKIRAVDKNATTKTTMMSPGPAGGCKKGKMVESDDDSDFSPHDSESSVSDSYSPPSKRQRKTLHLSASRRSGRTRSVVTSKGKHNLQESGTISKQKKSTRGNLSKKLAKSASSSQSAGITSPNLLDNCEPEFQHKALHEHNIEMAGKPAAKRVKLSVAVKQGKSNKLASSPVLTEDERDSELSEVFTGGGDKSENDVGSDRRRSGVLLYDECSSWVEVNIKEGKWVSLHLPSLSVGLPHLCEKHSQRQLLYVIAIQQGQVKDVTPRYARDWCTSVRRGRTDQSWWEVSLRPLAPPSFETELEDEEITAQLLSYPLPTVLSDYKNHPLYALKKHLLKFEAVYPPKSQVLGYFRKEPIYSRTCIHTLHTRETWLKEGRVVKQGEKPYNTVKARKKKGQMTLAAQGSVEVFGRWQTERYIPPPVVDGLVPKNEYGNVELFQPSMLPEGATHLAVPGIQRVARKLDIDFAPAMMGWDFHGASCYPIINGIVVAVENKEVLMDAWQQEQQVSIEKEVQKRTKKVINRWMKLTRGLLIREHVRKRFSLQPTSEQQSLEPETEHMETEHCQ